jgi:hypothetical protein
MLLNMNLNSPRYSILGDRRFDDAHFTSLVIVEKNKGGDLIWMWIWIWYVQIELLNAEGRWCR